MFKTCSYCNEEKDISMFSKYKRTSDGLQSRCKQCMNISGLKWRKNHPNEVINHNLNWRTNNPEYDMKWKNNNKSSVSRYDKNNAMKEGYGVYILIHIPTQKYYIGVGQLHSRKKDHFESLLRGDNECGKLQEHYNEDPCIGDWEFRVIKKWDERNEEEGLPLERKYIEEGFDKNPNYILNKE